MGTTHHAHQLPGQDGQSRSSAHHAHQLPGARPRVMCIAATSRGAPILPMPRALGAIGSSYLARGSDSR